MSFQSHILTPARRRWRRRGALVAAAVLAVTASACDRASESADTTTASTPPPITAETVPAPVVTAVPATTAPNEAPPPAIMPLTGLPLESVDDIPSRPALAVKIPMNDPESMPHAGLNQADIVFQTIINDGATRLIAVFHSQGAEPLGPIRSGRDQDIDILAAFSKPLLGSSGGNKGVRRAFREAESDGLLIEIGDGSHPELYYRRADRPPAPHNLFTDTTSLWKQTPDGFEVPRPVFSYLDQGVTPEGEPAETIDVKLASVQSHWEYDPETQKYFKWNNGSPHMTEDGTQVWADTVVVSLMEYGVSPIDSNNPLMTSTGSNPVFIFSRNTVRVGFWQRSDPQQGWAFTEQPDGGADLGLVPGRTWVEFPRMSAGSLTYNSLGEAVSPLAGSSG